jgi:hypothetical protein
MCPDLLRNRAMYAASSVRQLYHISQTPLNDNNIKGFQQRPFDFRFLYWQMPSVQGANLLNRSRPPLRSWIDCPLANPLLLSTYKGAESTEWSMVAVTHSAVDQHYMQGDAYCHPLRVSTGHGGLGNLASWIWNTPTTILDALAVLWNLDASRSEASTIIESHMPSLNAADTMREQAACLLFWHCVSMLHAEEYRQEHLNSLRYLWPRIPIPAEESVVLESAVLGRYIGELYRSANIHLPTIPEGFRGELQSWSSTLGWSALGVNNAHSGIRGQIRSVRNWSSDNGGTVVVEVGDEGGTTSLVQWSPVPEAVWRKVIGGRQTLRDLLERWRGREAFDSRTAHEYTGIIRRVAMLVRVGETASSCYEKTKKSFATRQQLGLPAFVQLDVEEEDGEGEEDIES